MDDEDLLRRAFAAYFRSISKNGGLPTQPSGSSSGVEKIKNKYYVILKNSNGILAVYRVRNNGQLKGLRRWPKELEN